PKLRTQDLSPPHCFAHQGRKDRKARKKRKYRRREKFTYVYKVLKQVHSFTSTSVKAMEITDSFVDDVFECIASEASRVACSNKNLTVTSREIKVAVCPILP
ncbi:histone H2B-like, partial [Tachyglossus aculeatus]|uniref:histone H2B-like n=1 Tax=Tachyglossus aculeatus TaxID=9261 RepID=UPI0018F2A826